MAAGLSLSACHINSASGIINVAQHRSAGLFFPECDSGNRSLGEDDGHSLCLAHDLDLFITPVQPF